MSKINYRPDIDGLRALAVISVIIFHINPKWLPSGFIGVDIFFVLSGYLITSIIYKEILENKFSFKEFYIRRIKRILPLFFTVLILGLLICWYVFLPQDIGGVVDSAAASIIFLANRYFARLKGGYFDIGASEIPFLHLWSLSIEEQFYFVFPIILLLIFKVSFLRNNKLKVLGGMILVLLLSSFIDLKEMGILKWDAYYLPHLRAGEMLVGSFLAVYVAEQKRECYINKHNFILSVLLTVLLLGILFLENIFAYPLFPGILALLPCILVALLIYVNSDNNIIKKIFSYPPIVWIGKISYSLYLWHWIILAIIRYVTQENELSTEWIFISIVLMFILSVFSYYLVENPIRKSSFNFSKSVISFYILPSIIVFTIIYSIKEYPSQIITKNLLYPDDICHNNINGNCIKGDLSKKPQVLVVGSSHVGQLNSFIDKVGKKEGWSAVVISSDSCPFLFNNQYYKNDRFYNFCKNRDEFFMENYHNYPIIVLHYIDSSDEFNQEFLNTYQRLINEGKKVYVVSSVVEAKTNPLRDYYFESKNVYFWKNNERMIIRNRDILSFIPEKWGGGSGFKKVYS